MTTHFIVFHGCVYRLGYVYVWVRPSWEREPQQLERVWWIR